MGYLLRIQEDRGFNAAIFSCIEKALQPLGQSVALAIFYQIENKFWLPREEFVSRPVEFARCLKEFLGQSGGTTIERLIVNEIRSTFGLVPSQSNSTLVGVIAEAKKDFLTR
jgi:hypothetical protein